MSTSAAEDILKDLSSLVETSASNSLGDSDGAPAGSEEKGRGDSVGAPSNEQSPDVTGQVAALREDFEELKKIFLSCIQKNDSDDEHDSDNEIQPLAKKATTDFSDTTAELLQGMKKDVETEEQVSVPILASLGDTLTTIAKRGISNDREKERIAQVSRPENCPMFGTIKVNPEIWNKMSQSSKSKDLMFQAILANIDAAGSTLAKLADKLFSSELSHDEQDGKDTLEALTNSLVLLCNAIFKINMRRRDTIKPELKDMYKSLCAPQNEVTSWLFGDDLSKAAKEAKEAENLTIVNGTYGRDSKGKYRKGRDFQPNRQNRFHPFLGKRGGFNNWKKPQHGQQNRSKPHHQKAIYRQ